jgi:hypothetical protein
MLIVFSSQLLVDAGWTVISRKHFPIVDMEGEKGGGNVGFRRLGGR